jgi:hypothetical protein
MVMVNAYTKIHLHVPRCLQVPLQCLVGSFPGHEAAWRGDDHQSQSNTELKNRVELHLTSHYMPALRVTGRVLPLQISGTSDVLYSRFLS